MSVKRKNIKYAAILVLVVLLLTAGCGKNGSAVNLVDTGEIDAVLGAKKTLAAVDALAAEQYDKYATYYPKAEYKALMENIVGSYSGIGIYFFQDEDTSDIVVSSVMKNGPAYKNGMKAGDIIVKLNGIDCSTKSSEEVSSSIKTQPVGTVLKVTVKRPEVGLLNLKIATDNVDIPTLEGTILADGTNFGVIKIYSFNTTTGEQFAKEFNEMLAKNISGLIIDLRDNGGGEVNSSLQICDMFVPKGKPLMYVTDSTGTFSYTAATEATKIPVVALQNENTASASEILLGAIQDNGAGKTIGTTSYGKGLVQEVAPLSSGAGFKATTSKYATSGDKDINKIGIKPDVEFPMPKDVDIYASFTMNPKEDPQLAKAVEVLTAEIAGSAK